MVSFFHVAYARTHTLQQRNKLFKKLVGAAAPGFNYLDPAPSVPPLISTEPVELLRRAGNFTSTDPFCFVNESRKQLKLSCTFYLQICAAPPSVRRTKIHGDKGYHTALIIIKQGDQHSGPNRNPKHNHIETKIHYSFCHVHVLTRIEKILLVTICRITYEQVYMSRCICYIYESNIWHYSTTEKRPKIVDTTKEGF